MITATNPQAPGGLIRAEPEAAGDPAAPQAAAPHTFSIKMVLTLFVLLIALPAWGVAAYVATQFAAVERSSLEETGRGHARAVAAALDFRLGSLKAGGLALATSPQLQRGDIEQFYEEAVAMARAQALTVALVEPSGRQLFNTSRPMGAPLPMTNPDTRFAEAVATREVQYSRVFHGQISKLWMVSLSVPVVTSSQTEYVIVIAVDSTRDLGEALGIVELPPGWVMSVIDEQRTIAARRPSADLFVGKPAHPSVLSVLTPASSGSGVATSVDSQPLHAFYHRLREAPWVVLAGVPARELDGAVWDALSPILMGGLAIVVATLLVAWLVGRRFASDLIEIAHAATAFRVRQEGPISARPTRIRELAELRTTLDSAVSERRVHEIRLKSLLADKDLLMQEVHHRVKNSLQLVRGILSLQARGSVHPEAKAALHAAASRILTVADVHQHLYQGVSTAEVNVGQYLADLANDLSKSLLDHSPDRQISVVASSTIWPSEKIIALGLIVTELVTNAIKYAQGHVRVSLDVRPDRSARLIVEDDGPGFAPDFEIGQGGGLGSRLITSLVRPEEGQATVDRSVRHGRVIVTLSADWRSGASGSS